MGSPQKQHAAALQAAKETVQVMLAHGADIDARDSMGITALQWAVLADSPRPHPIAVQALLELGADPNLSTDLSPAPAVMANTPAVMAIKLDSVKVLQLLLPRVSANGPVIGAEDDTTTTIQNLLLMFAAHHGSVACVELLLKHGADISAPVLRQGILPLAMAAASGQSAVVQLLLSAGADVHAAHNGWSSLHAAIKEGDFRMVQLLLVAGANPNADSEIPGWCGGCHALLLAVDHRHAEVVKVLLAAGARCTPPYPIMDVVQQAVALTSPDIVKMLLESQHPPPEPAEVAAFGCHGSRARTVSSRMSVLSCSCTYTAHIPVPWLRQPLQPLSRSWTMQMTCPRVWTGQLPAWHCCVAGLLIRLRLTLGMQPCQSVTRRQQQSVWGHSSCWCWWQHHTKLPLHRQQRNEMSVVARGGARRCVLFLAGCYCSHPS